MNLDELLARLAETYDDDPPGFDLDEGERRLREGLRRLRDDSAEVQRVRDIAEIVDVNDDARQFGHEALDRRDLDTATRHLRRAARHGNDEAAYWLALVLQLRGDQLRLAGRHREAEELTVEAASWRVRARESGVAEALESRPRRGSTTPAGSGGRVEPSAARHARSPGEERYAVGIELRPYRFTLVLADERGRQQASRRYDLPDMDHDSVVGGIAASIEEVVGVTLAPRFPPERIVLGVQLGGPIDAGTGVVHFLSKRSPEPSSRFPDFKWDDVPLGSMLRRATGLRTTIMNDADAFAVREQWVGVGQRTGNFAVVLMREGVGGSVVRNNVLFDGPVEIGNFITSGVSTRTSDAGQYGTLEAVAGTTAIIEGVSDATRRSVNDIETAVALAAEDSLDGREAVGAFTAAGVAIACAIGSYMIGFAGPSHVVLYAPGVMLQEGHRAADAFLDEVGKFAGFATFEAHKGCELVLRSLDNDDGAHGAALAALAQCFDIHPPTGTLTNTEAVK